MKSKILLFYLFVFQIISFTSCTKGVENGSDIDSLLSFSLNFEPFKNEGLSQEDINISIDSADSTKVSVVLAYKKRGLITKLVPTVQFIGKKITPSPDTITDFSKPVDFTITPEKGEAKTYTVTVSLSEPSSENKILSFKFEAAKNTGLSEDILGVINPVDSTKISVVLPADKESLISSLIPTIEFVGETIDPLSLVAQNFTTPVNYVVTPEKGEAKTYTVTVSIPQLELEISSVKFEKSKNLNGDDISEFYEKLFITKTPARAKGKDIAEGDATNGYPAEFMFTIQTTDIVENNIYVKLPYNSQLKPLTSEATVTATLGFKSDVDGVSLVLGDSENSNTSITGNTTDITFKVATTDLTKDKLESATPFKLAFKFSKEGFANKVYTMHFKFSETRSDLGTIGPDDFKFTVAATGSINTVTNFTPTGSGSPVAPLADTIVKAHYVTSADANPGTSTNPIEFQLRKSPSDTSNPPGELKTDGVGAADYFKADALKLPDGAYIVLENDDDVNPITGNSSSGTDGQQLKGASGQAKVEYKFTVVAQDGISKKYYKLTINADAPTASASAPAPGSTASTASAAPVVPVAPATPAPTTSTSTTPSRDAPASTDLAAADPDGSAAPPAISTTSDPTAAATGSAGTSTPTGLAPAPASPPVSTG
ncbi:hypothetical protein [Ichthyobacterium seriolicida]|uniref:Pkd domain containing protein n=1 Tax=Ichthyobacterium seriolicida TaxID=242600 RepID=A0A1J1DVZ2_9FLAO|nr:hypothetical protein [Ichthyobacterium seriolicida]BAV94031.1 hypothetical protein JBKA6_0018 [Ichthyobacterium seriolicida]